jgi:hypothetical protein
MYRDFLVPSKADTDRAHDLEAVLCRWHQWQQSHRFGRGYNSRSLVCGEYRASRQYDDANGALDDGIENAIMKTVDFQVSEMRDPHRAAVYCLAQALTIGVSVFTSPRLPIDKSERDAVVVQARRIITARLISAGVL